MAEPIENVRMFCGKHAPKPDERLQKVDSKEFIGRHVKIGFETDDPRVGREHMWVRVRAVEVRTGKFIGVLANDPMFCSNLNNGDRVIFKKEQIEAVE
jgi:uncharacterized protein YegJ (DUF2314 family)